VPPAASHPPLNELEIKTLVELAKHGPTHDLAGETRGRLALYNLIDEVPAGWTITAIGREALSEVQVPSPESEKPSRRSRRSPKGERHYGKKRRSSPWTG